MDINKPDEAGLKLTGGKKTFKCLTNTEPRNMNSVHIKSRFNKLTLSSTKKMPPDNERTVTAKQLDTQSSQTTSKMLTYSSSSESCDEEDDDNGNNINQLAPISDAHLSSSHLVNRLLKSSSSCVSEKVAEGNTINFPRIPVQSCEAPSFSQRLEVSDADETNCTELNDIRASTNHGQSIFQADTIIAIQRANQSNNLSLGTQMDRLQITASSDDLFQECNPDDNPDNSKSSSINIPVAQSKISNAISDLSQQIQNIELGENRPTDEQRRKSILTISSSQSTPTKPQEIPTRSSLASEEVYDVITLSDSDPEPANDTDGSIQPPLNHSSPGVHYNLSQTVASVQPPLVALELSSMTQNRLDRFFDNIPPLINREEDDTNKQLSSNNSLNISAAVSSTVSSIYISETDDENDSEGAPQPVAEDLLLPDHTDDKTNNKEKISVGENAPNETVELSDDDDINTEPVPNPLPSDLVPKTNSTLTVCSSKVSKTPSHRSPVVNISAKFQIRIQVETPQYSSSECSSGNNTSRRSSISSTVNRPETAANNDFSVNKQTERMSHLIIGNESENIDNSQNNPTISSGTNSTKNKDDPPRNTDKINSANDNKKKPKKNNIQAFSSPPKPNSSNQSECQKTPKSHKTPQLGKLRTPKQKPITPSATSAEDADFLSPPKKVNPALSQIVLNEEDQRLLNELYGSSWQTADLLKKCVLRQGYPKTEAKNVETSKPKTATGRNTKISETNATGLNTTNNADKATDYSRTSCDFNMFRKDIANHLDSTRIDEIVLPNNKKEEPKMPKDATEPVVASPFFKKPSATKAPKESNAKQLSDKKAKSNEKTQKVNQRAKPTTVTAKQPKKTGWRRIVDTDSDSELSDDTDLEITNDLSDEDNKPHVPDVPKRTTRSVRSCRKKPQKYTLSDEEDVEDDLDDEWKASAPPQNELTYLDLTHDVVIEDEDHQRPNASDQDLEELSRKILSDFEFKKPTPFQHTPAPTSTAPPPATPGTTTPKPKTKRKLFTPYFDDVQQATEEIYQKHEITPPKHDRLTIMNRNDDGSEPRCVNFRNGIPKFLLPNHKRLDDLRNEERLPLTPKNSDNTAKPAATTPSTPKNQRKVKDYIGTPKLPETIADIPKTPENKYGFLRSFDVEISRNLMHPTAQIFRDKFKTKKHELTTLLYALFNEGLFGGRLDVPVTWNKKMKTTAGYCYNRRRMGERTASIDLSDKVITSGDRLRCTLIHEMCHAATWIFNGDRGHGATWKTWAAKANCLFPDLPRIERCHAYDIEYKYTYQCTLCGAKSQAHSKSKKVELIRCAYCHGSIEIFLNKKDKEGVVCLTPIRKATGFAAFVKVAYKDYKVAGAAHADIMKQLSAKYASLSLEEKKQY